MESGHAQAAVEARVARRFRGKKIGWADGPQSSVPGRDGARKVWGRKWMWQSDCELGTGGGCREAEVGRSCVG